MKRYKTLRCCDCKHYNPESARISKECNNCILWKSRMNPSLPRIMETDGFCPSCGSKVVYQLHCNVANIATHYCKKCDWGMWDKDVVYYD